MMDVDLLVIGAGIQGAGVAQAAVAAGYRVAVIEADKVGGATSSKSSKLIHGGLRYLESGQFSLVRQSLKQRQQLLRLAPDLVHLQSFYIPIYQNTRRRSWQIMAGLFLYSLLGNFAKSVRFNKLNMHEWQSLDGLEQAHLQAVYRYYDAQTDDQQLTCAVMKSAQSLGAELLCPARFMQAQLKGDCLYVNYKQDQKMHVIKTRVLVNAAGPWVNKVLQNILPLPTQLDIDLVQGTHIIIDQPAPSGLFYVEAPQDKRAVFVMPWHGQTLIGTTETTFTGEPETVEPLPQEIEYLQQVYRCYFPHNAINLVSAFAGIRVLPCATSSIFNRARDTVIHVDRILPTVVTLYGGKLTSYAATAAKVLKTIKPLLPRSKKIADVSELKLLL